MSATRMTLYVVIRQLPEGRIYWGKDDNWHREVPEEKMKVFHSESIAHHVASKSHGARVLSLREVGTEANSPICWEGYVYSDYCRISSDLRTVQKLAQGNWCPLQTLYNLRKVYAAFLESFQKVSPIQLKIFSRDTATDEAFLSWIHNRWPTFDTWHLADPSQVWLVDKGQVQVILKNIFYEFPEVELAYPEPVDPNG